MAEFDYRAAREAVFTSGLPTCTRFVLLVLIDHAPVIRPSIQRIAERTGLSRCQVMREVATLEELGVLRVERSTGQRSSYELPNDWMTRLPVAHRDQSRTDTGSSQRPDQSRPATTPVAQSDRYQSHPATQSSNKAVKKTEGKQRRARAKAPRPSSSQPNRSKTAETLLPQDWAPTAGHSEFAAQHPQIDLSLEVVKFRGHFEGRKCLSWNGRFATWLAQAVEFARRDAARAGPRKVAPPQMHLAEHVTTNDDPSWLDEPKDAQVMT